MCSPLQTAVQPLSSKAEDTYDRGEWHVYPCTIADYHMIVLKTLRTAGLGVFLGGSDLLCLCHSGFFQQAALSWAWISDLKAIWVSIDNRSKSGAWLQIIDLHSRRDDCRSVTDC